MAVRPVVGTKVDLGAERHEVGRGGRVRARRDVLDELRAARRAVRAPELLPPRAIVGPKVEDAVRAADEVARRRGGRARVDVPRRDGAGASGGLGAREAVAVAAPPQLPVRRPELVAVPPVVGGKEEGVAARREVARVGALRSVAYVLHQPRAAPLARGAPELDAVRIGLGGVVERVVEYGEVGGRGAAQAGPQVVHPRRATLGAVRAPELGAGAQVAVAARERVARRVPVAVAAVAHPVLVRRRRPLVAAAVVDLPAAQRGRGGLARHTDHAGKVGGLEVVGAGGEGVDVGPVGVALAGMLVCAREVRVGEAEVLARGRAPHEVVPAALARVGQLLRAVLLLLVERAAGPDLGEEVITLGRGRPVIATRAIIGTVRLPGGRFGHGVAHSGFKGRGTEGLTLIRELPLQHPGRVDAACRKVEMSIEGRHPGGVRGGRARVKVFHHHRARPRPVRPPELAPMLVRPVAVVGRKV
mmetsp:Transcript_34502/g.91599  ORF Transcript_34502/g.91599 Transcript_34502/m.91599 type:complete len:473 (+) Transcript_34502:1382-2800(+)